ncbi:MAG: MMPL family transporter [Phycisphaerae bacterium]|nr:MMPL family transporter [Phycisphaerae bacterium]
MADAAPDASSDGPRWTDRFASLVLRRPWTVVAISLVFALAGAVLGWFRLPLDANTDSLISRDRPWMSQYLRFLDEFGDLEYLHAVIDTNGDRAAGERAVDDLFARLKTIEELPGVFARIEPDESWRVASRAMPLEDLHGLVTSSDALPHLANGQTALAKGEELLGRAMSAEALRMSADERERLGAAGILLLQAVGDASVTSMPIATDSLARQQPPRYLESDTGRLLFIAIQPQKNFSRLAAIETPLRKIRAAIDETRAAVPTVEIGLTGKPVLQADELVTSTGDTTWSFAVSLLIVAVICVLIYRNIRRPLLALIAFAMAIAWTQGAAALMVGRLTLLSMVFMLVMIGAGLDYGIHVVSRYTENRLTSSIADSVRRTMHTTAIGTLTGAATSAAVFALAMFSSFQGLRELGMIAGAGLVLCALAMVTTLPALLVLFDSPQAVAPPRAIPIPGHTIGISRRAALIATVSFGVATATALIAAVFLIRLESNLLELQAEGLESVEWEHRVLDDSASMSWFAGVMADDEARALEVIERARTYPEVAFVRSVFDVVQPRSPERDALRSAIGTATLTAPQPAQDAPPASAAALRSAAQRVATARALSAGRATPDENARLGAIADRLRALATTIDAEPDRVRADIDASVAATRQAFDQIGVGARMSLRDALPAAVRDQFVSPSGKLLVMLVPSEDAWELEPLERFVHAIRDVDPNATGVPITQFESIRDMVRAFVLISLGSFVAVAILTWLDFRRISAVAVCTGVLAVGITLTLGFLGAAGIPLSLANFFGIPILIGLGIDSNIHLLHRADETRHSGDPRVSFGATRSAVIFTALTTAIGFGGQIFASHRGMQGLGWIMFIGSLICLATSVWLMPALLRLMRGGREPRESDSA